MIDPRQVTAFRRVDTAAHRCILSEHPLCESMLSQDRLLVGVKVGFLELVPRRGLRAR